MALTARKVPLHSVLRHVILDMHGQPISREEQRDMGAKPRQPTPEERAEIEKLRQKLEKKGVVKPHEPQHRDKPKGK